MAKRWFFSLLAAGGLCFFCAPAPAVDLVDGIVAVVNDDIITYTDLNSFVGHTVDTLRNAFPPDSPLLETKLREARKEALDQLIERRLIVQQFNSRGGKVPDSLIEKEVAQVVDEQYGRDRSVFIKTLEALGLNLETYKERIREKIIVRYMQDHEVNSEIIVSPFQIEQYYKDHPNEFREGEKVKLRAIYIKKGTNPKEVEGARSLINEILVKLTTGSDFDSIAGVYSEGPSDFGWVGRDSLRKELAAVAFAMNPGQLSKIVETSEGFYVLRVDEKKPEKVTTMDEARDIIERLLIQQNRERLQRRWIQSLKRKAYIRLY